MQASASLHLSRSFRRLRRRNLPVTLSARACHFLRPAIACSYVDEGSQHLPPRPTEVSRLPAQSPVTLDNGAGGSWRPANDSHCKSPAWKRKWRRLQLSLVKALHMIGTRLSWTCCGRGSLQVA